MDERKDLATVKVDEDLIKPDLALMEKYQNFSSELLRLSLLGLGVFGFLFKGKEYFSKLSGSHLLEKGLSGLSIICFAIGVGAALFHRYYSTDSLARQIRYLRLAAASRESEMQKQRKAWRNQLARSGTCLVVSSAALGLAALFLALVFLVLLR
jgi:hypothetical protein